MTLADVSHVTLGNADDLGPMAACAEDEADMTLTLVLDEPLDENGELAIHETPLKRVHDEVVEKGSPKRLRLGMHPSSSLHFRFSFFLQ